MDAFVITNSLKVNYCPRCATPWNHKANICPVCRFEPEIRKQEKPKTPKTSEAEQYFLDGSDIEEFLNLNVGEGLRLYTHKKSDVKNLKCWTKGADTKGKQYFVVAIPIGTYYEQNIQKFLEFDEFGPYIPVKTPEGKSFRVAVQFISGIYKFGGFGKGMVALKPLPKLRIHKPKTFASKIWRIFEIWSFKTLEYVRNVRNLKLYKRQMSKNGAFVFQKAMKALPASPLLGTSSIHNDQEAEAQAQ